MRLVIRCCVVILAVWQFTDALNPGPNEFVVNSLPKFGAVPFALYTGYLPVNDGFNSKLFYWFAPSQSNPSTDPISVWNQGGPGCSSNTGFFIENGPFHFNGTGLELNPFGWNRNASILWIDQPIGVGFSFVNVTNNLTSVYVTNETTVANHVFNALVCQLNSVYLCSDQSCQPIHSLFVHNRPIFSRHNIRN
jgi:hypothetical protein